MCFFFDYSIALKVRRQINPNCQCNNARQVEQLAYDKDRLIGVTRHPG
jgi:hypothetical protein